MRGIGRWIGMAAVAAIVMGCGEGGVTTANEPLAKVPAKRNTLSVGITGVSTIRPNTWCQYDAYATGGAAPYTYAWTQTAGTPGPITNSDTYLTKSVSAFDLTVTATDSNGATTVKTWHIYVNNNAGTCLL